MKKIIIFLILLFQVALVNAGSYSIVVSEGGKGEISSSKLIYNIYFRILVSGGRDSSYTITVPSFTSNGVTYGVDYSDFYVVSADRGPHFFQIPSVSNQSYSLPSSGEGDTYITPQAQCTGLSWSDCNIIGSWSSEGIINCEQTSSLTPVGCTGSIPGGESKTKQVKADIPSPISTCNTYANNSDTCKINISIHADTEGGKGITGWGINGVITNLTDTSGEKSDRINNTGTALNFSNVSSSGIQNSTSNNFNLSILGIKSRAPFTTNNSKLSFKLGGTSMELNNINYNFKKPFVGELKAWNEINKDWEGVPTVGTQMLYKLQLQDKSSLNGNNITGYNINDFSDKVEATSNDLEIEGASMTGSLDDYINGTKFTARINTSENATSLNDNPGLQINLPIVSYELGGEIVRYYISGQDTGNDTTPVKITGDKFLGVKIVGILQGDGKSEFTGQESNVSDITKAELRQQVRRNAYKYTKNMKSDDVVNSVKYVDGKDIKISGDLDYETLIVKNGNVIIGGNLNTSGKKLGIIVLKDGYDVNSDYKTKGNVYVDKNVTYIDAIIYADGGLISSNGSTPYTKDSTVRTTDLQNQLVLKGSLFTRNTIGGAILAGGYYILPGGEKIGDFDKAMIYDLNYTRRGYDGWDGGDTNNDGNNYNLGNKNPFVIIYNPIIQTNPPKGFE
ncbi:MAG: hypothetical protein PHH06_05365 [Candidatus Gracilibacteria bacterium]|nr:hypothetical protein [Candidatus Gracilibacteria bacterium]